MIIKDVDDEEEGSKMGVSVRRVIVCFFCAPLSYPTTRWDTEKGLPGPPGHCVQCRSVPIRETQHVIA